MANVTFIILNSVAQPLPGAQLTITPTSSPTVFGTSLALSDPIYANADNSGFYQLSGLVSGTLQVDVRYLNQTYTNYIVVPNSTGNYSAGNLALTPVNVTGLFGTLQINLTDIASNPNIVTAIQVTPQTGTLNNTGALIINTPVTNSANTSGTVSYSGLIPATYRVDAYSAKKHLTTFYVKMPSGSGVSNAKDILVLPVTQTSQIIPNTNYNGFAWTASQSDARYLNVTGLASADPKKVVLTTGNQGISGEKVFWNDIQVNGVISGVNGEYIDLGQSKLHDAAGNATLDWENQQFIGNWSFAGTSVLIDNTLGRNYVDVNNGVINGAGSTSIDFVNRILTGGNWTFSNTVYANSIQDVATHTKWVNLLGGTLQFSGVSLDWVGRHLVDSTGNLPLNWQTRLLQDTGTKASIDWQNRLMSDAAGNSSVDYNGRQLLDGSQRQSVNWNIRYLVSSAGTAVCVWDSQYLVDSAANISVDWTNRILSGAWSVNGNGIVSTSQTGGFIDSSKTGQFVDLGSTQTIVGSKYFTNAVMVPVILSGSNKVSPLSGRIYNSGFAGIDNIAIDWGNAGPTLSGAAWGWSSNQFATNSISAAGSSGPACVSVSNRTLLHASNNATVDWGNQKLYSFSASQVSSVDWLNRFFYDASGNKAEDYTQRLLVTSGGATSLDWQNRNLSGAWTINGVTIGQTPWASNENASYYNLNNVNNITNDTYTIVVSGQGVTLETSNSDIDIKSFGGQVVTYSAYNTNIEASLNLNLTADNNNINLTATGTTGAGVAIVGNFLTFNGHNVLTGNVSGPVPVRSGSIQLHPAAAKLPSTGMAFIDGSNLNFELLYSGVGLNPSGLWQVNLPNNYSGNPIVTLNATVKTGQVGTGYLQFDIYALSIPSTGNFAVNGALTFVNSGIITLDNNQVANAPRKVSISLTGYSSFGADQFTLIQIARNNSVANNASGNAAYVGGYFGYTSY